MLLMTPGQPVKVRKHHCTFGGVLCVAANHLVSVGLEGNAGRVAKMRKISKMVYTSSWYFWHSEGWRVRNGALDCSL